MIVPYKQTLTHSCLAACFLMLRKKSFTELNEQQLALEGSRRMYPFYVVGIPMEFAKKFDCKIHGFADNAFFASVLEESYEKDKRVAVVHKKITIDFIIELLEKQPVICHIDDHVLGDYSHASHFIILEKATERYVYIIDPWDGKRKKIRMKTLEKAIHELKTHVKMCPLLFSVGE